MTITEKQAAELRKPFVEGAIGKLPRSTCRACTNNPRKRCDEHQWVSNCPVCKGSHTSATLHLDFVGHAVTTDRLLAVDPAWTWEPVALDAGGLPAYDSGGNLWIRLTVCGVTRLGVGDGKSAKECIGDAIRNAAMRFGVALDLWSKDELEQVTVGADRLRAALHGAGETGLGAALDKQAPADDPPPTADPAPEPPTDPPPPADGITAAQIKAVGTLCGKAGMTDRAQAIQWVSDVIERPIASRNDLTKTEAARVIDALQAIVPAEEPGANS